MQFIEAMELLRVQGPKMNIIAVGDYLRADGLFKSKKDFFDPISFQKEIYEYSLT
jgi:type III secretory pathway lipoprotein EscJ